MFSIAVSAAGADEVTPAIAADIAQLQATGTLTVAGESICADRSVITFYTRRDSRPAWNVKTTAALLRAVRAAADDGLNPSDYHLAAIESLTTTSAQTIAARDLLSSDAFLLLALHLTQGRVNPVSLIREWCVPPRRVDIAGALQTALDAGDVEGVLRNLAPRHKPYVRLRAALASYRQVENTGGWPLLAAGPPLRLGDRGERVAEMLKRLAREPGIVQVDPAGEVFDRELELALRQFQELHSLTADGIAGGATRRELNVSAADRIEQIELNMERWRWMPEDLGDFYSLVNIAAFRFDAVEHSQPVLSMKTVVGKSFWETPFFPATITELVINPSWFVPESIANDEMRPRQRRDPSFYAREHIEVTPGGTLRQLPGAWNALGRIKFNMPNPFLVYLHDTPAKGLFSLRSRAFSHGCIRVEDAIDLALYLLRDQPEWNRASLQAAIDAGNERLVHLTTPEPVYILYWTAWADTNGQVRFHPDVYNRDTELGRALRSPVTAARPAGH